MVFDGTKPISVDLEEKSVKVRWIRVAAIDSVIIAGIWNMPSNVPFKSKLTNTTGGTSAMVARKSQMMPCLHIR